jgi:Ca2+-binding RTX toxin-like protein
MATYEGTDWDDYLEFQGWPPGSERIDTKKGHDIVAIRDDWSTGTPATINVYDANFAGFANLELLDVSVRQAFIRLGSSASAAFAPKRIELSLDASGPDATITLDASGLAAGRSVKANIGAVSDAENIAFKITGSNGNDIFQDIGRSDYNSTKVSINIDGGAGNDSFSIYQGTLEKVTRLEGGAGKDHLHLYADSGITDAHFAKVSGFETLEVSGDLTLGIQAQNTFTTSRIQITYLGNNFDSTGMDASHSVNLYAQADSIRTGAGDDTIQAYSHTSSHAMIANRIEAGGGNDTIIIDEPGQIGGGTWPGFNGVELLDGGTGTDTIRLLLSGNGSLQDSLFTQVRNMEAIKLPGGDWTLNLGANAKAAFTGGLVNIWGDSPSSLSVKVDPAVSGLRINAVGSAGDDTIKGGSGADTIKGGMGNDTLTGGGGDDTIVFDAQGSLDALDTVSGGDGYDMLRLLNGMVLSDWDFADVSRIEAISMGSGAYSITIGDTAKNAFSDGNVRVNAASATSSELDASALGRDGYRFNYTGGAGTDKITLGGNIATVSGGAGADEFVLVKNSLYRATITDFKDGTDHLVIDQALLPPSLHNPIAQDALIASITKDTAAGLLIDGNALGLGGTLTLAGMTKANFDHNDFIIV